MGASLHREKAVLALSINAERLRYGGRFFCWLHDCFGYNEGQRIKNEAERDGNPQRPLITLNSLGADHDYRPTYLVEWREQQRHSAPTYYLPSRLSGFTIGELFLSDGDARSLSQPQRHHSQRLAPYHLGTDDPRGIDFFVPRTGADRHLQLPPPPFRLCYPAPRVLWVLAGRALLFAHRIYSNSCLDSVNAETLAQLSDKELVHNLLGRFRHRGTFPESLHDIVGFTAEQLSHELELSTAGGVYLAAVLECVRRLRTQPRPQRLLTSSPELAVAILDPLISSLDHEQFYILPLDTRSRLIGAPLNISRGDIDGTDAGPRIVFRTALSVNAASVILAHNHPTGNVEPSSEDWAVTKRLLKVGRLLDVTVADHLIVAAGDCWNSLRRINRHLFEGACDD